MEEALIKKIFEVTLSQDDKNLTLLHRLKQTLTGGVNVLPSAFSPTPIQSAPVSQQVSPSSNSDEVLLPCEFCDALFPLEILEVHQANCSGIPPQQQQPLASQQHSTPAPSFTPTSTPPALPQMGNFNFGAIQIPQNILSSVPSSTQQQPSQSQLPSSSPSQPLILRASQLDQILAERIQIFGMNAADKVFEYLGACFRRVGEERAKKPAADQLALLDTFQKAILKSTRQVILAEHFLRQQMLRFPMGQNANALTQLFGVWDKLPSSFFKELLQSSSEEERHAILLQLFMQIALDFRRTTMGQNLMQSECLTHLKRFFAMLQEPLCLNWFARLIGEEVKQMRQSVGREVENRSVLAGFLSMTVIRSMWDKIAFDYFPQLIPNYPEGRTPQELQMLQKNLQQIVKQGHDCVHAVMKKLLTLKEIPEAKENMLKWISSLLILNESRLTLNKTDPMVVQMHSILSTEGFLVNLVTVLFQFCKPFLNPQSGKVSSVDRNYFLLLNRFDFSKQAKLCDLPENSPALQYMAVPAEKLNFITDIFFTTMYAIHICLVPEIEQLDDHFHTYQRIHDAINSLKAQYGDPGWKATPDGQRLYISSVSLHGAIDSIETQIMEQDFLDTVAQYCQFTLLWFAEMKLPQTAAVEPTPELRRLFASFPEFLVRDIADLLSFLLIHQPQIVLMLPRLLQLIIDWGVSLLNMPSLVKSPIIRSKLSNLLSHIIFKKKTEEANIARHGAWAPISAVGQQFYFAFQENRMAQTELAPGLMTIYIDVDIVEGLDVDKEKFDKYSIRRNLILLLSDLWEMPLFRASFKKAAQAGSFVKFVGTVLNDLIHCLDDSLNRFADLRQLQLAMEDKIEWNNQDPTFKKEREQYYEIQEGSARGFLSLANTQLDLLLKLTGERDLVPYFMEPKMVVRTQAMLNHFFDALCGPKCVNLKVRNPEKYGFSPKELLRKISTLTLAFVSMPPFLDAAVRDPDYSPDIMKQALYFLSRERILAPDQLKNFEAFTVEVNKRLQTPSVEAVVNQSKMEEDGGSGGSESSNAGKGTSDETMEVEGEGENEQELEKIYIENLKDLLFDSVAMIDEESGKLIHHYSNNAQTSAATSTKMARLTKECQTLATSLPLNLNSSVFVRADEERMDVMKALIIGPKDTPYALGCFLFDIYFPPSYPNDPPLVNLQTTGNGTVRFNPNLYNCGKVCLSLLGTWHGDNQTSKWNASTSSLYQVLVSIQALILVDQPYYNEPAYEAQRGTKEGDQRSSEYNENIRLATIRFAMIDQLQRPSLGFEEVIQTHFRIQKQRVLKQCAQWVREATLYKSKFERTFELLKQELNKLN